MNRSELDPDAVADGSINRRAFLGRSAYGLGGIALAGPARPRRCSRRRRRRRPQPGGRWRGVINPPHFPVKAKRVIHLCMAGGPVAVRDASTTSPS